MIYMKKIYINVHPERNSSTVVLGGNIDIRNYVGEVDWITWLPARRSAMVTGDIGDDTFYHIVRVEVLAQRLHNAGYVVYMRDGKGDKWELFKDKGFTEDYMLSIECESREMNEEIINSEEIISTYEEMLNDELYEDDRAVIELDLATERRILQGLIEEDNIRKKKIREVWK